MKKENLKSIGRLAFELLKLAGLSTALVTCVYGVIRFIFGGTL